MQSIDLNLWRVLDAVLATGSVTLAASRLNLSVPATSHALTRLRQALGDQLMVRAGRQLVPTARALALRDPLAHWLAQGDALCGATPEEAWSSLPRCFVVRAPEGVAMGFGAAWILSLRQDMPRCSLRFVPESTAEDSALREGGLDLDLGHFEPREPEMLTVVVSRQRLVAVVRADHPLAQRGVTARRLCQHPHVDVQRRPGGRSPLDSALAARGLTRDVVLTVPHATVAALAASRSALVALINERTAEAMAPKMGMRALPLPFLADAEPLVMAWHPRQHDDPAHRLLRQHLLKLLAASIPSPKSAPPPAAHPP